MEATLSDLFRTIESELGTHEFCLLVLKALKKSLMQYKFSNHKVLLEQFHDLFDVVRKTKPRYAIVNDSLYKVMEVLEKDTHVSIKDLTLHIDAIHKLYVSEMQSLINVGQSIDVDGKNVLIYDHSHSVQNILRTFKEQGRSFRVLVAEQDLEKTEDNILFLHQLGVPYKVVPSYMLSHVDETVDLLFFGAVTLQKNGNFVMDPGSKSIISHFYLEKKPVYVFLTTSKFSLWQPKAKELQIYTKSHKRCHHTLTEIEFERLKFSHDRVPSNLISHVVTEGGIRTSAQIVKIFETRLVKRRRQHRQYFS